MVTYKILVTASGIINLATLAPELKKTDRTCNFSGDINSCTGRESTSAWQQIQIFSHSSGISLTRRHRVVAGHDPVSPKSQGLQLL